MPTSTERLAMFVRGMAFRDPDLPIDDVVAIFATAIVSTRPAVLDDRAMIKLAALAVAFWRSVREVAEGRFELDLHEEAVLDAVRAHLGRSS